MKLIHHFSGTTQVSSRQSYETHINWTIGYPAKNKRQPWQSDYIGVVRLSPPDKHFWVGIYCSNGTLVRLRLQEKDGPGDSFSCSLHPTPLGRFEGQLLVAGITLIARLQPVRHPQTGVRRYRVHFEPEEHV